MSKTIGLTVQLGLWAVVATLGCTLQPATEGVVAQETQPKSASEVPRRRALLVGINDYSASRLRDAAPDPRDRFRLAWPNIKGAVNDVQALRETLTASFGFRNSDILTVTDQDATRERILRGIEAHLVRRARKGDLVVFYYAGHGSQVRNTKSAEPDKLDESIVPADSRLGAPDIRDKELRPLFNQVLAAGARLVVVLDSCHSGSGARGLYTGARPRRVETDPRDVADGSDHGLPLKNQGALVLSAAQDDGWAFELTTEDGQNHGAFTWALLRALRSAAEGESAERVFLRARAWLRSTDKFQEPVLEGFPEIRRAPLFGGRTDQQDGRTVVVAEAVRDDGTVVLRGGWANGLAAGSELRKLPDKERNATPATRLEVEKLQGLGRSTARILDPDAGERVRHGDLFEIVSWVAPPGAALKVRIPRMETTAAAQRLAQELSERAGKGDFQWVEDPMETSTPERPLRVLRWHGGQWQLLGPVDDSIHSLGASPTADQIASHLSRADRLFVNLPAFADLVRKIEIGPGTRHGAVEPVDDPARDPHYQLVGRLRGGDVEYAWVRPNADRSGAQRSGLPLHSPWYAAEEGESVDEATGPLGRLEERLERDVLHLAKIHAWHQLPTPPNSDFPYKLRFRDEASRRRVGYHELEEDENELYQGRRYSVVLALADEMAASNDPVHERYVYVFSIDSAGGSSLLYPRPPWGNVENRFPLESTRPAEIALGERSSFDIVGPFGSDTFFLLTTAEPLLNPLVLDYEGLRPRGPKGSSPLEELLSLTGGSRGPGPSVETPMKWSIERQIFRTVEVGGNGGG